MSIKELIVFFIILAGLVGGSKSGWLKKIDKRINPEWVAMGLVVVYAGFYFVLKYSQFSSFITNAFDFSIFDYALFNSAHGRLMEIPFLDGNFFKEHFSPILLLYIPFYWLHASAYNLLVFQALHVALAAIPIYFIGRKLIDKKVALLAVFIYLNNWFVVHGLFYDFHIEMVVPLLMLSMFWAYLEKRHGLFWIMLLLVLACKEDMSLYLAVFGLYVMFFQRKLKLGGAVFLVSVAWLFLAISMIRLYNADSSITGGYKFLARWDHFGKEWFTILYYLISHPMEIVKPFITSSVFQVVGSVAFLPLLSSWGLLLLFPIFINGSSSNPQQASFMLYYAAPVIPFLMIGFLYGWKSLNKYAVFNKIQFVIIAMLITLNIHIYRPDSIEPRHKKLKTILNQLVLKGTVCAHGHLISHLNYYQPIQLLPEMDGQTNMVLMDIKGNPFPLTREKFSDFVVGMKSDENYRLIFEKEGLFLFEKSGK